MNRIVLGIALLVGCHRDRVLPPAADRIPAQAAADQPLEPSPAMAAAAAAPAAPAASAAPVAPSSPASPASPAIGGVVVETMDASTYTYARLDQGGTELWIAGPKTALAVGTKLANLTGTLMTDFHSKTLDRTFAQIYFVNAFGAGPAPAPVAEAQAPMAAVTESVAGTVVETMDAGGYTYALIDQQGTKVWTAGPATKLDVGGSVAAMSGTLMTDFRSTTLNRTFDQIYFVGAYRIAK